MGFETLCTLFYDDPALVGDMITFWSDHVAILLQRALSVVKPDCVHLSEDMAYKSFSMISPAMAREYLHPSGSAGATLFARPAFRCMEWIRTDLSAS